MLTCPWMSAAVTCPAERPDAGSLAAHLAADHLVSPSRALQDARAIADKAAASAPVDPTAAAGAVAKQLGVKPDHPLVTQVLEANGVAPPPTSTSRRRNTVADLSTAITCAGVDCKKQFVRQHPHERFCPECSKVRCSRCKRRGGTHSTKCSRARQASNGAHRSSAKRPTGGGKDRAKSRAAVPRDNGATPATKKTLHQSLLVARVELEAELGRLEAGIAAIDALLARASG